MRVFVCVLPGRFGNCGWNIPAFAKNSSERCGETNPGGMCNCLLEKSDSAHYYTLRVEKMFMFCVWFNVNVLQYHYNDHLFFIVIHLNERIIILNYFIWFNCLFFVRNAILPVMVFHWRPLVDERLIHCAVLNGRDIHCKNAGNLAVVVGVF